MSAARAFALPDQSPGSHGPEPRHIEIVTSSAQRLARPRLVYSLVATAGLFAVLAIQLLLSIVLADGAYQISALQAQQKELTRSHQSVAEALNILNSPQNLAVRAESLGMVSNNSSAYLNLASGVVIGAPTAAKSGASINSGTLLVANSLLEGMPPMVTPATATDSRQKDLSAPNGSAPPGSVASVPTGIPGPTTR